MSNIEETLTGALATLRRTNSPLASIVSQALVEIQRLQSPWIPVGDAQPPEGVEVLCATPRWESGIRFGRWWPELGEWRITGHNHAEHVSHWMPLPDVPAPVPEAFATTEF